MIKGQYTCHCCGKGALTKRLIVALYELEELIPLESDIIITSGYRCKEHNFNEGGGTFSKHLTGQAIDFYITLMDVQDMLLLTESVEYFYNGGIGYYIGDPIDRIHADVRISGKARWYKHKGVFVNHKGLFQ